MTNDPPTLPLPDNPGTDEAANLIRRKLDSIYADEPDAVGKAIESEREPAAKRSKHQKFMAELAESGKPFHQIQAEWHEYYQKLPDREKHEVWNEFYSARKPTAPDAARTSPVSVPIDPVPTQAFSGGFEAPSAPTAKIKRPESVADLKRQITSRVKTRGKLSRRQHLKSLMFGLSVGSLTVLLLLFGFFNERFIAPFITPSRTVSSTPLIIDENGAVGPDPKLIIPKINLEIPVVYDVETIAEDAVQAGMENGVVHYATTSHPGEKGNGAIFGHSSSNILNRGKYKFALVLLNRLELNDTFYLEKDGVRYVYKVFDKKVVKPTDVWVLNDVEGKTSTMALITCDPPGTAINRLVVWGEQISPDPAGNTASTAVATDHQPETLAANAPSLWSRIVDWVF